MLLQISVFILLQFSIFSNAVPAPQPSIEVRNHVTDISPSQRNSVSPNAHLLQRSFTSVAIPAETCALNTSNSPILLNSTTSTTSSLTLFDNPITIRQITSFPRHPCPVFTVATLLRGTAIAARASLKTLQTPSTNLTFTLGHLQLYLTSHAEIAWETVPTIADKLLALTKAGWNGFYGAVMWHSSLDGAPSVICIGIGLATAMYYRAGLRDDPIGGGIAAQPAPGQVNVVAAAGQVAAQVLGQNMLAYYGDAAPAAR